MITLYHCVSARSFRPLWILEELRLPYELKMLPFPPRFLARDYLEVNALGTVPTLIDGNVHMTESAAMCQYLAAKCDGSGSLDVPSSDPAFGFYLNWLHFGEATLTYPQTLVLRYGRFEPIERRNAQVEQDYRRWFLARLRIIDPILSSQPYLCASRFTAADISVGYALMLAEYLDMAPQFSTAISEYWERLKQRAGYLRAIAAQSASALAQGVSTVPAPLSANEK
ncbi:MAG TPA: glutathione S-transferase family protein [Burkholderiaceae bacterium]|nr:glutathione S-transferase family protein [Burkholderiaceae bacterium]